MVWAAHQVNTGKVLLPLKEELPPRQLLFTTQQFPPGQGPKQPHTAAQWELPEGSCHRDKPKAEVLTLSKVCSLLGGCFPINTKPLPFFAGFLLLFSCPLTSCNRFSSSFFFSWANSSFDFAACFLPLAAVEEEHRVSESAGMQGKEWTSLFYRACTSVCTLCSDTANIQCSHSNYTSQREDNTWSCLAHQITTIL